MKKQIIIMATKNSGKSEEIIKILGGFPVEILDLNEFGKLPQIIEDADNFEDNAYAKAFFHAKTLGFPALADDSGLVIESLGGEPGVRSARWAGPDATDNDKCKKILERMEGIQERGAAFVCALVLAVPSGPALTWVGRCEGLIAEKPVGNKGFGYDPIFYYPPLQKTFGELEAEEKNKVSHRGRALEEFKSEFEKVGIWLEKRLSEEKNFHSH